MVMMGFGFHGMGKPSRGVVFGAIATFGYYIQRMAVYVITLRASTDLRGLRLILKRLWRVYQLRCISVEEDTNRSPRRSA
jgi:hypothetical protein